MTTNLGNADRILRLIAGAALLILAAMGFIGAWGWIGVVPLVTALAGGAPPIAFRIEHLPRPKGLTATGIAAGASCRASTSREIALAILASG